MSFVVLHEGQVSAPSFLDHQPSMAAIHSSLLLSKRGSQFGHSIKSEKLAPGSKTPFSLTISTQLKNPNNSLHTQQFSAFGPGESKCLGNQAESTGNTSVGSGGVGSTIPS